MTGKESLEHVRDLDRKIEKGLEQLQSLKDLAEKCTNVMTGMPGSGNKGNSRLEQIILKIIEQQDRINAIIDEYVDLSAKVYEAFGKFANYDLAEILELRYVKGLEWDHVAEKTGYSTSWLFKVHKKALAEFEKYFDEKN